MYRWLALFAIMGTVVLEAPAIAAESCDADIGAIVEDSGRIEGHLRRDPGRKPCEVLTFAGIGEGQVVLEVMGTQGYYTELLSRLVGNNGTVYHHNNSVVLTLTPANQIAPIRTRIEDGILANVEWLEGELGSLPLEDESVDMVTAILVLHDYYWMSSSPESVALPELYRVLKPGGLLFVVDHAAVPGSGTSAAVDQQGLHRIDEEYLVQALEAIGFRVVAESDVLRNPEDDRTKPFFDPSLWRDKTDRFVLKMEKTPVD